jgi:hypothetical protein
MFYLVWVGSIIGLLAAAVLVVVIFAALIGLWERYVSPHFDSRWWSDFWDTALGITCAIIILSLFVGGGYEIAKLLIGG